MGWTAKILGRPRMLVVTFASAGEYSLELVTTGSGRADSDWPDADGSAEPLPALAAVQARAGKAPLIVVACGYGVIAKDAASEVAAKVMAPESGFLWRRDGNAIVFVREAQMAPFDVLKALAVTCAASAADAEKVAGEYYTQHVRLRHVVRPEGAVLASLLARRVQLPVLGAVLLLLAVNAAVGPGINSRWAAAQAEKSALQSRICKADDTSRGRAQALSEWSRTPSRRFGWLCDRAGSTVPRDIALTSLSVEPLLKTIEEGRKPQFSEGEMVIAGRSPRSESVSEYAAALGTLGMARRVRLASVEFDREKAQYNFRIHLEL